MEPLLYLNNLILIAIGDPSLSLLSLHHLILPSMLEEVLLARVVLERWVVDLAYCLGRVSLIPVEMPHQIACVANFVKT